MVESYIHGAAEAGIISSASCPADVIGVDGPWSVDPKRRASEGPVSRVPAARAHGSDEHAPREVAAPLCDPCVAIIRADDSRCGTWTTARQRRCGDGGPAIFLSSRGTRTRLGEVLMLTGTGSVRPDRRSRCAPPQVVTSCARHGERRGRARASACSRPWDCVLGFIYTCSQLLCTSEAFPISAFLAGSSRAPPRGFFSILLSQHHPRAPSFFPRAISPCSWPRRCWLRLYARSSRDGGNATGCWCYCLPMFARSASPSRVPLFPLSSSRCSPLRHPPVIGVLSRWCW